MTRECDKILGKNAAETTPFYTFWRHADVYALAGRPQRYVTQKHHLSGKHYPIGHFLTHSPSAPESNNSRAICPTGLRGSPRECGAALLTHTAQNCAVFMRPVAVSCAQCSKNTRLRVRLRVRRGFMVRGRDPTRARTGREQSATGAIACNRLRLLDGSKQRRKTPRRAPSCGVRMVVRRSWRD